MTKTSSPTVQQSSLPNGRPRIEERVWILENRFDEDGVIKPGQLPLSSAVDSTREDVAATSLAVKKTYDEATKKGTLKQVGRVQLCNEFIEDDTKAATPGLAKKANDLAQDALDKANEAADKAEEAIDKAEKGGLTRNDIIISPSLNSYNECDSRCFVRTASTSEFAPFFAKWKEGYDWYYTGDYTEDIGASNEGAEIVTRHDEGIARGGTPVKLHKNQYSQDIADYTVIRLRQT